MIELTHVYVRIRRWRFFQNSFHKIDYSIMGDIGKIYKKIEGVGSIFTERYEWILERSGVSGLGGWDQNSLRQTMHYVAIHLSRDFKSLQK